MDMAEWAGASYGNGKSIASTHQINAWDGIFQHHSFWVNFSYFPSAALNNLTLPKPFRPIWNLVDSAWKNLFSLFISHRFSYPDLWIQILKFFIIDSLLYCQEQCESFHKIFFATRKIKVMCFIVWRSWLMRLTKFDNPLCGLGAMQSPSLATDLCLSLSRSWRGQHFIES